MASTIPSLTTGVTITSADWDTLTQLNTQIGLYGYNGALSGSPPAANAPAFLLLVGAGAVAVSGANFNFGWSPAFPNGLLACYIQPLTGGGAVDNITIGTCTKTTAVGQYFHNGSAFTGTTDMVYWAIGF